MSQDHKHIVYNVMLKHVITHSSRTKTFMATLISIQVPNHTLDTAPKIFMENITGEQKFGLELMWIVMWSRNFSFFLNYYYMLQNDIGSYVPMALIYGIDFGEH